MAGTGRDWTGQGEWEEEREDRGGEEAKAGKGGGEQPWGGGEGRGWGGRRGGRGRSGDWRRWEWKGLMLARPGAREGCEGGG